MNSSKTKFLLLCLLIAALIGDAVFFYLWMKASDDESKISAAKQKYPFVSQQVLEGDGDDIIVNFLPLRQQLHQIIDPYQNDFAMYFEYLPSGTSIGINRTDEFTAASLLKIPVVMAYYNRKENLGIKDDQMVEIQPNELNNKYGDLYKKGAGYKLTLDDAVKLAITESDNTASLVIADHITNSDYKNVYDGLDIPLTVKDNTPVITANDYTDILKSLFYSSILSPEDSQKILSIMTQTKFHDMLPAGVPSTIPVAHKIGLIDNQIYQDCGIVYAPKRPYALCMISKSDRKTAQARMSNVSKVIYNYVSKEGLAISPDSQ
jgi:beta-lactamase class A